MPAHPTQKDRRDSIGGSEVAFHASGFMVRVEGSPTTVSLARFRHFLRLRRLAPTERELIHVLERAKQEYLEQARRLYVCNEHPCRSRRNYELSSGAPDPRDPRRLTISTTGCQGLCKQAPVASLR